MDYNIRKATSNDLEAIWNILTAAILRRKLEGSSQWQDGYPNQAVIQKDIENDIAYVLTVNNQIIAYCAIQINDEPAYENIVGSWLSHGDSMVFHRVAIAEAYLNKGYATQLIKSIEKIAVSKEIFSIKADTNFDNLAMLKIFEKLAYTQCGEVLLRGNPRIAFEKILK